MGSAIPKALARYADAVHEAVDAAGYGAYDMRAGRTGLGLISVKVEIRTENPSNQTRGGTNNASKDPTARAAVIANLARAGYEVQKVRSSVFFWRHEFEDSATFYIKPRENG